MNIAPNYLLNKPLKLNSYAKVNLFLEVVKKLPNNYHEIITLFSLIDLCDTMCYYLTKSDYSADYMAKVFKINYKKVVSNTINFPALNVRLTLIGEDDEDKCLTVPLDHSNTAVVAFKKFFDSVPFKKPDDVHNFYMLFQKNVPAGAGLAGGSSNAAATLKAMNHLFNADLDKDNMRAIGASVGADVPFMLEGGAALAENIGDRFVSTYDLPAIPMIIVYPNFEVASKDAYNNVQNFIKYNLADIKPETEAKVREASIKKVDALIKTLCGVSYGDLPKRLYNRLEEPVLNRKHQIRELKETLCGMGYTSTMMTGSGSSVFTLFRPDEPQESLNSHFEKIQAEMHKKYSKTYRVFLTKTRKAIGWEKMLLS